MLRSYWNTIILPRSTIQIDLSVSLNEYSNSIHRDKLTNLWVDSCTCMYLLTCDCDVAVPPCLDLTHSVYTPVCFYQLSMDKALPSKWISFYLNIISISLWGLMLKLRWVTVSKWSSAGQILQWVTCSIIMRRNVPLLYSNVEHGIEPATQQYCNL